MNLARVPQRTNPGLAFSMVERALNDCLGRRQFGMREQAEVLAFFFGTGEPECVYCGSEIGRWDHVVPVMQGGEAVLGNTVPACPRCHDSKRDLPFEEWMVSDARWSPATRQVGDVQQRAERISAYMQHFGYAPRMLEHRLEEAESSRVAQIRSALRLVRQEMGSLIADYRARTGTR